MKHTYKNSFYNPESDYSRPSFDTEVDPIEYKGYQIFQHTKENYHVVKDGVCVAMNPTLAYAKTAIDNLINENK